MIQHELTQGSPEWHRHRANYYNASDAPVMMGVSPYKTRSQLLHETITGIVPQVDAATQKRFDDGHRFEALARTLAEEIIGEELYPVVGSDGKYSASFDGLTMLEDVVFEHKTLNDEIRSAQTVADLHPMYHIQMEQQLLVSGAEKCLFLASKWDDKGNLIESKHFWYEPDGFLRKRIVDGWSQFERDLADYTPPEIVEPPKAEPVKELPVVTVQVRGEMTLCNLRDVTPVLDRFLAEARTELTTDEDFAQAEAESKVARDYAKKCKLVAKSVVDQMQSISEVTRTLEEYAAKFDALALKQEKAVKTQKESIKAQIITEAKAKFIEHVAALEHEVKPISLNVPQPDFAGAVKNKRTLTSLHDSVNTELANAKIKADEVAKDIRVKLARFNDPDNEFKFLFNDLQYIITNNSFEAFMAIVDRRIEDHQKAESSRLERERERIRAEEQAKAQREAEEKARREDRERIQDEQEAERLRKQQEDAKLSAEQHTEAKRIREEVIEPALKQAEHIKNEPVNPLDKKLNALVVRVEAGDMSLCDALKVAVEIGIELAQQKANTNG